MMDGMLVEDLNHHVAHHPKPYFFSILINNTSTTPQSNIQPIAKFVEIFVVFFSSTNNCHVDHFMQVSMKHEDVSYFITQNSVIKETK
jgi:hypothetical protein